MSKTVTSIAPTSYIPMIETAENVSERYRISREAQDEYALQSQQRVAAAQREGRFDDEIVPMKATRAVFNRETKETTYENVVLDRDECKRPNTTLDNLEALQPVWKEVTWVT